MFYNEVPKPRQRVMDFAYQEQGLGYAPNDHMPEGSLTVWPDIRTKGGSDGRQKENVN